MNPVAGTEQRDVLIGRIGGAYGVKGWVRVESFTDPAEKIFQYKPWRLNRNSVTRGCRVAESKPHGKGLVVRFDDVNDRQAAAELTGLEIFVDRAQLPEASAGEFYWADLIGLDVRTTEGVSLGTVDRLIETGANDVLVVSGDRRRLIPFLRDETVRSIDLDARTMVVAWDPDF